MIDHDLYKSLLAISNEIIEKKNIPLVTQKDINVIKEQDYNLSTGILLRIGETTELCKQYENGYLKFGCPANWIDYAKKADDGIADRYEALIGHVKKDDPRLWVLGDDGVPLNMFRSLWLDETSDGWVYVRYIYHCLTPAICFFSIPVSQMARSEANTKNNKDVKISVDLTMYKKAMGFENLEGKSALVITTPEAFFNDLQCHLRQSIISCEKYNQRGNIQNASFLASMVHYDLDINKEFFEISAFDDLFRKRACFSDQSEARIIIPSISFCADPVYRDDSYKYNSMNVLVPNIKSYSILCPANEISKIDFFDFSDDFLNYTIGLY